MESVQKTAIEANTLYRKVGNRYVPVTSIINHGDYMTMQPGLWIVSQSDHSRGTTFIGKVSELQKLDSSVFASLKNNQTEVIAALRQAIEETKEETPDGVSWWTIDLWRITDSIFKVLATK